jgi:putative hydrolase of the HAD superfamily
MILLLDAANTIIHKPSLFDKCQIVLKKHGWLIPISELEFYHKMTSEIIIFPDKTNKEFYDYFNKHWFYSIGIIASNNLLEEIFNVCNYLPWEKFKDTLELDKINVRKAVLSNFHKGLDSILDTHFPNMFSKITISEIEKVRKPDVAFYNKAIMQLEVNPSEIIYIGDSIKLDLEPALECGMNAWIIDRNNHFPHCTRKISNFKELHQLIK